MSDPYYSLVKMFTCINCGAHTDELYRQYSSSVLKVIKCDICSNVLDKYIEYDPVIVLVDLILLEKAAYHHLFYNSNFNSYWKLIIVLILGESFHKWMRYEDKLKVLSNNSIITKSSFKSFARTNSVLIFQGERNFYFLLAHTACSLAAFVLVILSITELKLLVLGKRPHKYKSLDLIRALVVGGCTKLLGLLDIVWQNTIPGPHHIIIYGYTVLCLLTTYSVICESGRIGSLIGLAGGLLAHNYVYNIILELYNLSIAKLPDYKDKVIN